MATAEQWLAKQEGQITLYHGTSGARLQSILSDGIQCNPGIHSDMGQPAGVFCTMGAHKRYSQFWAQKKAKEDNSDPIVIKLTVDASIVAPDPVNPRCFLIVLEEVAPDAIEQIDRVAMVSNMSFSDMATYAR